MKKSGAELFNQGRTLSSRGRLGGLIHRRTARARTIQTIAISASNIGVLAYALASGMAYAAFSAIVLLAIGRGAAATKYATLSSLGNLPVVYMTAANGWVHDRFGTAWMLHFDDRIKISRSPV
jgi:hypothetical protein